MEIRGVPFQTIDWARSEPTLHPGDPGTATWRTVSAGNVRVRRDDCMAAGIGWPARQAPMLPMPIRIPVVVALSALFAALLAGCSSSSSSQAPDASAADGSPTMAFACGTATCSAGQWCVHECSCGGVAACNPTDDAGACPTGSTLQTCGAAGHMGCIIQCHNPAPACQGSIPPACYDQGGGMVQCACPG